MSAAQEPGSIRGLYNVYGKSEQRVYGKSEQGEAENYARMPESVLFDDALSVTARCVYGVLRGMCTRARPLRSGSVGLRDCWGFTWRRECGNS